MRGTAIVHIVHAACGPYLGALRRLAGCIHDLAPRGSGRLAASAMPRDLRRNPWPSWSVRAKEQIDRRDGVDILVKLGAGSGTLPVLAVAPARSARCMSRPDEMSRGRWDGSARRRRSPRVLVERRAEGQRTHGEAGQARPGQGLGERAAVEPRGAGDLEGARRPSPVGEVGAFEQAAARIHEAVSTVGMLGEVRTNGRSQLVARRSRSHSRTPMTWSAPPSPSGRPSWAPKCARIRRWSARGGWGPTRARRTSESRELRRALDVRAAPLIGLGRSSTITGTLAFAAARRTRSAVQMNV